MQWKELIIDGYSRVLEVLEPALEGISPEDLNRQPRPDCNNMGWITWHLIRGQDRQIADLMGMKQQVAYIRDFYKGVGRWSVVISSEPALISRDKSGIHELCVLSP